MPITISDQKSITITHSYINGTTWFIKFLSRVHAHVKSWSVKEGSHQENIADITLERLNSGGHSGTTTGNAGRKIFPKNWFLF